METSREANRQYLMNKSARVRDQWKSDDSQPLLCEKRSSEFDRLKNILDSHSVKGVGEESTFVGDEQLKERLRSNEENLLLIQSEDEERKAWSSEALEWERRNDRNALIEEERIRHAESALKQRIEREEEAMRREREIEEWRRLNGDEGKNEAPKVERQPRKAQVSVYKERNKLVLFVERLLDRFIR